MKKRIKIFYLVFILLLSVALFFIINSKNNEIKRVFLITIDTLRADHVGNYGYFRDTTPFIDSLSEKGYVFEKAISQSATTCPSIASIFTGIYPSEHKVLANGYVLDDSIITLPELLKKRGFQTVAFTSTDRHFLASNLDQGFDTYIEPEDTNKSLGLTYMPAELVINKAVKWMGKVKRDGKLFIWIHIFDPHMPYNVTKSKIKKYFQGEERKVYRGKLKDHLEKVQNKIFKKFWRADKHFTRYDTEIRSVDEKIKDFYRAMEISGLTKDSLWVITGDHGEGLGQHNWKEHALEIYQESIHVPLIFYLPGEPGGVRFSEVVGNFNIFSTILDMTGKLKESYGGITISSRSLAGVINRVKKIDENPVFTERQVLSSVDKGKELLKGRNKFYEEGEKYSIQNNRYKFIFRTKGADEFFDLKLDPFELVNLLITEKDNKHKEDLKKKLLKIVSGIKKASGVSKKIASEKVIERLKSLGYIF